MFFHPALFIFTACFLQIIFFKQNIIFKFIAIIFPFITIVALAGFSHTTSFSIFNLNFIADFNPYYKLIALAFLIVTLAANLYALGLNKKLEIILGEFYCANSLICLLAKDFLSIFISLELMMVAASFLIFINNSKESLNAAKQYFLTHLLSGSLILIGFCYLINKNNNTEIFILTDLIKLNDEGFLFYLCIFIGCLINVAAYPFSAWMVNCYPTARSVSLIYLISFTTKIAVITLIKLFSGFEILKYMGIIMMLYGNFYGVLEENIKRMFCYLAITQLGFMLIGISTGTKEGIIATLCFVFIHIIYKALFVLLSVTLSDNADITMCSELKRIKNPLMIFAMVSCTIIMSTLPFSLSFFTKLTITSLLEDNLIYFLILLSNILNLLPLPIKEYYASSKKLTLKINFFNKISIILMTTILITVSFGSSFFAPLNLFKVKLSFGTKELQQILIIGIALIIARFRFLPRFSTVNYNVDLLQILSWRINYLIAIYIDYKKSFNKENMGIFQLQESLLKKLSTFHNQQISICIIFFLLSILILTTINL